MHLKPNSSIEKIIYLVRHGESEENAAPVFQSPSAKLSAKGQQQAEFIAQRILSIPFDVLISSPLQRTRQTAEAISKATGRPVEFSELFVESIRPTSVHSKPYTDKQASEVWQKWCVSLANEGSERAEDGETYEDVTRRADKALDYLLKRPEKTIIVVTHGHFLKTIIAKVILGETFTPDGLKNIERKMRTDNTGISVLAYESDYEKDPSWRLWVYNDHAHLGE